MFSCISDPLILIAWGNVAVLSVDNCTVSIYFFVRHPSTRTQVSFVGGRREADTRWCRVIFWAELRCTVKRTVYCASSNLSPAIEVIHWAQPYRLQITISIHNPFTNHSPHQRFPPHVAHGALKPWLPHHSHHFPTTLFGGGRGVPV